ncbi:GMC family oxidoreductase N-terminal domain-containing protein [Saccharopolyspora spinosporotrichia]
MLFNTHGRATGVEYQVYDDPRSTAVTTHYVEGSMVVLAAHAIENAKLLLASGVKNDNIGRNLMDHPLVVTQGLMPEDVGPHRGPPRPRSSTCSGTVRGATPSRRSASDCSTGAGDSRPTRSRAKCGRWSSGARSSPPKPPRLR